MTSVTDANWNIPGTVHILKQNYGAEQENLITQGDIVLLPQPSDSPNDPLNWNPVRKYWHAILLMVLTGLTAATSNSASAAQQGIIDQYKMSWGVFNTGAGVLFCGIGYWTLVSGPSVYLWGVRLNYIFSCLFGIIGNVWYAKTANPGDAIVSQLFIGASESAAEAVVQHSISQVFFSHQLSPIVGIYVLAISVGTFLGPLLGGYAADNLGWPWVGWLGAIVSGFVFLLILFGLEETYFDRNAYVKKSIARLESLIPTLSPTEQRQHQKTLHILRARALSTVEAEGLSPHIEADCRAQDMPDIFLEPAIGPGKEKAVETVEPRSSGVDISAVECIRARSTRDVEAAGPKDTKRTYWQSMALVTPAVNIKGWGFRQYAARMILNLRVFAFPAIIYSGLQWGFQDAWLTFYMTVESDYWSAPPYNYGDSAVAIMNVPTLIGAIIGCLYGSYGSDWICDRLARRNNGVFEAEYRLYTMLPNLIISPLGMFLLGIGTGEGWAWPVPYVGLGFIGFGYGCSGDLSMTYVMDCYPAMVLEGFIGVSAINNTLGMIFSFVCDKWLDNSGPKNTFIAIGILDFFCLALTIPLIIWGKSCRKWTTKMYNNFVQLRDGLDNEI